MDLREDRARLCPGADDYGHALAWLQAYTNWQKCAEKLLRCSGVAGPEIPDPFIGKVLPPDEDEVGEGTTVKSLSIWHPLGEEGL
jgi:hypothetical protein